MQKIVFVCCFFVLFRNYAQEERFVAPSDNEGIQKQESNEYDKEFTYGLQWATNGGILAGISLKYAWQKKDKPAKYNLFGLDIVHVEHPKEQSTRGFLGNYTYAKQNDLIVIRPHFGQEFILFNKAAEEGVQVSFIGAGGLSLGFMKPYFYEYSIDPDFNAKINSRDPYIDQTFIRETVITKANADSLRILDNVGLFSGFGNMKPYLGIHAKASLNFEYGIKSSVAGIEIGIMSETYFREMPQMFYAPNKTLFLSLFATLYYGLR